MGFEPEKSLEVPSETPQFDAYGRRVVPLDPVGVVERRAALDGEVRRRVAAGARVEVQNRYEVIIATGREVNHVMHAVIAAATILLWVPVWVIVAMTGGVRRQCISVDLEGNVRVEQIVAK